MTDEQHAEALKLARLMATTYVSARIRRIRMREMAAAYVDLSRIRDEQAERISKLLFYYDLTQVSAGMGYPSSDLSGIIGDGNEIDLLLRSAKLMQKALEQAPHAEDCASTFVSCPRCGSSIDNCRCEARYSGPGGDAVEHECDCWKRDALSASPPEAPAPHPDTIRLDKLENANSPFNPSMPLIWVADAMHNSKIGVRAAIDEVFDLVAESPEKAKS